MKTWVLLISFLVACRSENGFSNDPREGRLPVQLPSAVARLAEQACACASTECIRPLQAQMERIIAAQHPNADAMKDNAAATAKTATCAARLSAKQ